MDGTLTLGHIVDGCTVFNFFASGSAGLERNIAWKLSKIGHGSPLGMPPEAGHAIFHIEREAETRQLSVVWNINPHFALFLQNESQVVSHL